MKYTPSKINIFLIFNIPSAYISGVRVKSITDQKGVVTVKHRWINKNPFKSLYWATQGMASELATGILVMKKIDDSGQKISMLVTHQTGTFTKKATGRIEFICDEGDKIKEAIDKTVATGEGQKVVLNAKGYDAAGDCVSSFTYEWGIKLKRKK